MRSLVVMLRGAAYHRCLVCCDDFESHRNDPMHTVLPITFARGKLVMGSHRGVSILGSRTKKREAMIAGRVREASHQSNGGFLAFKKYMCTSDFW